VRFNPSGYEDRVDEMREAALDSFLQNLPVSLSPEACARFSLSLPIKDQVANERATAAPKASTRFPGWFAAEYYIRILRNVATLASPESLEAKTGRALLEQLAEAMQPLGRPLQQALEKLEAPGDLASPSELDERAAERMLQLGHLALGAVFTKWHTRCNIVGRRDSAGMLVRDFIKPLDLSLALATPTPKVAPASASVLENGEKGGKEGEEQEGDDEEFREAAFAAVLAGQRDPADDVPLLRCVPPDMRTTVAEAVRASTSTGEPLQGATGALAHLAYAVRLTAADEMRALITYNADNSRAPDRDAAFTTVVALILRRAIYSSSTALFAGEPSDLFESLLAAVALEETLGVREPRACVARALELALRLVSQEVVLTAAPPEGAEVARLAANVLVVEKALEAILRLPSEAGSSLRSRSFRRTVDALLENAGKGESQMVSLPSVYVHWPVLGTLLGLEEEKARAYTITAGHRRFDRAGAHIHH
jgi:hypothetical protein